MHASIQRELKRMKLERKVWPAGYKHAPKWRTPGRWFKLPLFFLLQKSKTAHRWILAHYSNHFIVFRPYTQPSLGHRGSKTSGQILDALKKIIVHGLFSSFSIDMKSVIRPVSLTRSLEEIIVCVDIGHRRNVGVRRFDVHGRLPTG